jgi:hypothetical protein
MMFESLRLRTHSLYQKHERSIPIIAFVCGFLFDMTFLHRIDEPKVMIQQAAYLLVSIFLITIDFYETANVLAPPPILKRVWKYREFILHFLLGTLLNSYTIFYFKSASSFTSFIFILLLVLVLTAAEFKRFGESQQKVHMALWSLCLISYFQSLLPILLGYMGIFPFLASGFASILAFSVYYKMIRPKLSQTPNFLRNQVLVPYAIVQIIFTGLYFAHAIPPVPLSVSYMGIYHEVKKEAGNYELSYTREPFYFWQHGDQTFAARAGDTIYAFVQIYSPSGFKDQLMVRWLMKDPHGHWQSQDAIPLVVTGGREAGYRAVTQKNNYQPGKWRVQVETIDEHEVGRLDFVITSDTDTSERSFHIDTK